MTITRDPVEMPTAPPLAPPEPWDPPLAPAFDPAGPVSVGVGAPVRHRMPRLLRGRAEDPAWVRPSLLGLLVGTLVLYLWDLGASGWANSFYSAAAQAGSVSWKAFFFGSSDAASSITIDKPPLFLWPQALAVRVFGLNAWSILVPQALMGVATVGVLYAAVRRWFSPAAGLLAGLVMALTPVAALMFRFNNPDALLTLLMTVAAYTALRAIDDGRARWFALTGIAIGLGFLTKQLQVLLVVPPFAVAYLLFGRARFGRRVGDLTLAFAAMVAAAGWWVAIVELWPASSRPYIGGSQTNSLLGVTFGYNGFGRLTGDEVGSVGGGLPGRGGMWGATGLTRLLDGDIGGQIGWLIPGALAFLVIGLWLTRRAPRTDLQRASLVVWGGWLIVTALTFSLMSGIFHAYYTVALAPAIGALVGIGASLLWTHRDHWASRLTMAALTVGSGLWAAALLGRAPGWNPWLAGTVVTASILVGLAFVISALPAEVLAGHLGARILGVAAGAAIVVTLAAPTAWSLNTVATEHRGSIVTAGPPLANRGFGRLPLPIGGNGPIGGNRRSPVTPGRGLPSFGNNGTTNNGTTNNGFPGFPLLPGNVPSSPGGNLPGATPGGTTPTLPRLGGGTGSLLEGAQVRAELVALLEADASDFRWVAATTGSQNGASYQLSTQEPVMAIGGFNGSDPSPTLARFQRYVADGEIHYYIASGLSGVTSMGGSDDAHEIATWVQEHFMATRVGGVTLYDLSVG